LHIITLNHTSIQQMKKDSRIFLKSFENVGGAKENRTPDLMTASHESITLKLFDIL